MPLTHGHTETRSIYESAAYFLWDNATERESLFFGDVEPDSISLGPQTKSIWKAAAPKIPHTLPPIFIECLWTSDQPDDPPFGHLNPVHLVNEPMALVLEVYKVKNNLHSASALIVEGIAGPDTRTRKGRKPSPVSLDLLRGMLNGVTIYIVHCQSDVGGKYNRPVAQIIGAEARALVDKKELGVEAVMLEQGTRIHEFRSSTPVQSCLDTPHPHHRD